MNKKILGLLIITTMIFPPVGIAAEHTPPPAQTQGVDSDMISVNFNQADIQSVFRILALKGDVNIVAGPEIAGEVTLQLNDVPWESAFDTIVRTYGFTYEKEGNIYYVLTPESLEARRESGSRTEVITLEYADLTQVQEAMDILSEVNVDSVGGMNQILLTATPANLEAARDLIGRIDVRQPQVHIDTKIIRTALTKGESLGINWNIAASLRGAERPTTFPFSEDPSARRLGKFLQRFDQLPVGQTATEATTTATDGGGTATSSTQEFGKSHSFPFVQPEDFTFGTLDFTEFTAAFNMLKNRANTKIVSNPRIVVLNHQEARVQAGREIGLPTFERNETTGSLEITGYESRNDGIELLVTPHITKTNEIMLEVTPELTRFLGFREIVTGSNVLSPEFETTVAETQVLINSGDTLVIGGLISEAEGDNHNKVPFLSRIPVLGWLFKHKTPSKERSETIIFVTVSLADDVFNQGALEEWKQRQVEYKEFRQESEEEFKPKKFMKKAKMTDKAKDEEK